MRDSVVRFARQGCDPSDKAKEQFIEINPVPFFSQFLKRESSAGLLLMAVAAVALVIANSPLSEAYFEIQHAKIGGLSVLHWINDALMAMFFLLVGLEIKREILEGQLSS